MHAAHWYQVAEPNLADADKEQAHQRLVQCGLAEPDHAKPADQPRRISQAGGPGQAGGSRRTR